MSENICVTKYKCRGFCCINSTIPVTQREYRSNFEGIATPVEPEEIYDLKLRAVALSQLGQIEVYYSNTEGGTTLIQLIGPCPQLDKRTYNCLSPNKPQACGKGLPIMGSECQKARVRG